MIHITPENRSGESVIGRGRGGTSAHWVRQRFEPPREV